MWKKREKRNEICCMICDTIRPLFQWQLTNNAGMLVAGAIPLDINAERANGTTYSTVAVITRVCNTNCNPMIHKYLCPRSATICDPNGTLTINSEMRSRVVSCLLLALCRRNECRWYVIGVDVRWRSNIKVISVTSCAHAPSATFN